ncbi:glycosyltransferase family 2 protein [Curtobacterium sp. MCBD17_013]|uniref:glycosyltransferase n=1 Tax=Curtobacterium sp. MCBD17_013 TaxID=2175668 RepID=UPI000DA8BB4A|nr:glycosyltransferase [Curtobacterium sp. MCBD17_013]PZF63281.1 glycosyltransferase family 2 protein [Curtobacterium sp. MCBD17_013]
MTARGGGPRPVGHAADGGAERLPAEYVLPLRWDDDTDPTELAAYLARLVGVVDVTVVDGSSTVAVERHRAAFPPGVRVLPPRDRAGRNGKVRGVVTGVETARHDAVVVADDDVRYDEPALARVVAQLADAEVVRPQNHFHPSPWHARWDTGRTLLNRALASDWPGTLGVRRGVLLATGGYDGDVLFENCELVRTVLAVGGRQVRLDDCFVARRPPTVRHFLGQRVRQAYDSWAQPLRLALELAVLPAALLAVRRPRRLVAGAITVVGLAELGRRRAGGTAVFPPTAALWSPLWLAERAVCSWLAVVARARGGVRYAGERLPRAATPLPLLRRRLAGVGSVTDTPTEGPRP